MKLFKTLPWFAILVFSIFTIIVLTVNIPTDDQFTKFLTNHTKTLKI